MATKRKAARRATGQVSMLLNGQAVGQISPTTQTVGDVANQIARDHGLKSYSILVNGVKVTTEGASKKLAGARTIEIFAKETRGLFSITYGQSLESGRPVQA